MDVAATQLLTVDETAKALRQSRSTIRRKIAEGALTAVRLGEFGPLRVPADELDKHLRPANVPRRENVAALAVSRRSNPQYSRGSSPAPGDLRPAPGGQPSIIEGMR